MRLYQTKGHAMPPPSLKAIQTRYGGRHFRSRLEARWALFFDLLAIGWDYECDAFATSAGPYLPDFRLQVADREPLWFEVKPTGAEIERVHRAMARDGAPIVVAAGMPRNAATQGEHLTLLWHAHDTSFGPMEDERPFAFPGAARKLSGAFVAALSHRFDRRRR